MSRGTAGAVTALLTTGSLAGCSLLISTSDLTGGSGDDGCEAGSCITTAQTADASGDSMQDSAPPTVTCGDADVVSDESNCGACGNVCAGATPRCLASACVPGCPGGIVYVSPTGADTNDGCTTSTPLATITHAIGMVSAAQATGESIHVCHGTFTEPNMVIDYPVSIFGSYDCATWMRTPTYGYPSFDGVNATILATTAASVTGNTFSVVGDVIFNSTIVDGLTVQGPGVGNFAKLGALNVSGSAAPTLSNNDLEGATSSALNTVGLRLSIEGAPLVVNNRIGGGGGTPGSMGIDVGTASALYVHDNVISGGTSAMSSWGILANTDTPLPGKPEYVMRNTINGGTGTTVIGLDLTDLSVSVIGNTITGGAAACAGGGCSAIGIRVNVDESELFSVTVAQNLVTSGTVSVPMGGSPSMIGLSASGVSKLDVLDNAIQAGSGTIAEGSGISLQNVTGANVQGNTVYGFLTALDLDTIATVDIDGNLFLADTTGTGVVACSETVNVASFSSNAFVNMPRLLLASCSNAALTTVSSIESTYKTSAVRGATGNRRVSSSCSGDTSAQCATLAGCVPGQADANACIARVLATWDDATQGAADLLDVSRTWKLGAQAPCGIAQSFSTPLVDVLGIDGGAATAGTYDRVDITGTTRAAPISIGAYQDNGACSP